jgi:hypothetical protein
MAHQAIAGVLIPIGSRNTRLLAMGAARLAVTEAHIARTWLEPTNRADGQRLREYGAGPAVKTSNPRVSPRGA